MSTSEDALPKTPGRNSDSYDGLKSGTDKPGSGQSVKLDERSAANTPVSKPSTAKEHGSRPSTKSPAPKSQPQSPKKGSGDVKTMAVRRRGKKKIPDDAYRVTFSITISVAVPTSYGADQVDLKDMVKKKKKVVEAPSDRGYYHIEYQLLPTDKEPVRADIVTFGMAAKIYTEKHEAKVVKTWQDGDTTWIGWTHKHTAVMTDELITQLHLHNIEVRIWDQKEKCSSRARFDRPKAFKLPTSKGNDLDDTGGVKALVLAQSKNFMQIQPKKSYIDRPLPEASKIYFEVEELLKMQTDLTDVSGKPTVPSALVSVQARDIPHRDGEPLRTYSRLGRLAGVTPPSSSKDKPKQVQQRSRPSPSPKQKDFSASPVADGNAVEGGEDGFERTGTALTDRSGASEGLRKSKKKMDAAQQAAYEHAKKYGIGCIYMRMAELYAGRDMVTGRLEKPTATLEDMFVSIETDKSVMSPEQVQKYNPIVIRIQSAANMPKTPLSFIELNEKCYPAYCQYKFLNQSIYKTVSRETDSKIYWDDVNVVLAGTLDKAELRQYLNGPHLEVEVHDRDRKPVEEKLPPSLFGDDLEDEKISNVGTVGSRRTIFNPFSDRDKPWDPFGIAKFDLSGLLLGQKCIELRVPIQPCPVPDLIGLNDQPSDGKIMGIAGAIDGPGHVPLPAGHYLQSNASLKLSVEIAQPLTTPSEVAANEDIETSVGCPFAKIVYILDNKNNEMLKKIKSTVLNINARALDMVELAPHVLQVALSTYKLTKEQQEATTFDVITGFHVMDGKKHIILLEGLRDGGIKELWETLPKTEDSSVQILYHRDLAFTRRLYGELDVDLCRIKLHEPLGLIVQQSLLYVRDMVPRPCLQALLKIYDLTSFDKLRDVIRNDLFPTVEMVTSMSKEFGIPITADDFEDAEYEDMKRSEFWKDKDYWAPPLTRTSRMWTPIDNYNDRYYRHLDEVANRVPPNYLRGYKEELTRQSTMNHEQRVRDKPITLRVAVPFAHNYSGQALNTMELAKERLRQELAVHPNRRFTYCQEYHHSMTVEPVNIDDIRKQRKEDSKSKWKTEGGWKYPGVKSTLDSNVHVKRPDDSRIDELKFKWIPNILHGNILEAPLDRERYTWSDRRHDLDLWKRPPHNFGNTPPVTIHEAGDKLQREQFIAAQREMYNWFDRIIVDDINIRSHRCLPKTEMTESGAKSSNQLDRLHGLLKDKPQKHSFSKHGMHLKDIPPLNVVLNPSVDTAARNEGVFPLRTTKVEKLDEKTNGFNPGPFEDKSWTLDKNKIPARDYEHDKFRDLKGHDFNVYHRQREYLHRRLPKVDFDESHSAPLHLTEYHRRAVTDVTAKSLSEMTTNENGISLPRQVEVN